MSDPAELFREAIARAGLVPPNHIVADGALHRFSSSGKRGDLAGWYTFHLDAPAAGSFGDWRMGLSETWVSKPDAEITKADRQILQQRMAEARRLREQEQAQRHESAQDEARARWAAAKPAPMNHGYLTAKRIQPHGLRVEADGWLLVPLRDEHGHLHSLQRISPSGEKRFLTGGRIRGCFFGIASGPIGATVVVAEGVATAATIHEATGLPVAAAMNAGNLEAVTRALRSRYSRSRILIGADDDAQTKARTGVNVGLEAAKQAATCVDGVTMVRPVWKAPARQGSGTDFNDLGHDCGLQWVARLFSEVLGGTNGL